MFEILLLLSYRIDVNSESYLPYIKLKEITYGFNKNAIYNLEFSNVKTQMIFGLATRKEMKHIEKKKDTIFPCIGTNFSKIQYLVLFNSKIPGKISKKDVLIPYFYKCENEIQVTLDIKIDNCNNNLDYRLQNVKNFIIFVSCVTIIYLICFIVFSCCIRKTFPFNSFNILLILFILTLLTQDFIGIYFFIDKDDITFFQEYFNQYDSLADLYTIVSDCIIVASFILLLIYSFMQYLNYTKKYTSCFSFALLFFPIGCLIAMIVFMLINVELLSVVTSSILVLVYGCFVIFMRPICSLVKLGFAFYIIGVLLGSPGVSILIYFIGEQNYMNLAVLDLSIIFMVFQILSMICMFFVFWSKKMNGDQDKDQFLLQSNSAQSYTQNKTDNYNY